MWKKKSRPELKRRRVGNWKDRGQKAKKGLCVAEENSDSEVFSGLFSLGSLHLIIS